MKYLDRVITPDHEYTGTVLTVDDGRVLVAWDHQPDAPCWDDADNVEHMADDREDIRQLADEDEWALVNTIDADGWNLDTFLRGTRVLTVRYSYRGVFANAELKDVDNRIVQHSRCISDIPAMVVNE